MDAVCLLAHCCATGALYRDDPHSLPSPCLPTHRSSIALIDVRGAGQLNVQRLMARAQGSVGGGVAAHTFHMFVYNVYTEQTAKAKGLAT